MCRHRRGAREQRRTRAGHCMRAPTCVRVSYVQTPCSTFNPFLSPSSITNPPYMYTSPDGESSATAWWPSRVRGAGPALRPPSESGSHCSGTPRWAAQNTVHCERREWHLACRFCPAGAAWYASSTLTCAQRQKRAKEPDVAAVLAGCPQSRHSRCLTHLQCGPEIQNSNSRVDPGSCHPSRIKLIRTQELGDGHGGYQ